MKTMERLMDKLVLDNRPPNREKPEPQIRNPNFIRPLPPPQIMQRDQRNIGNMEDQQIRPPLPKNMLMKMTRMTQWIIR